MLLQCCAGATADGLHSGNLLVWGSNERGQLGLSNSADAGAIGRQDTPLLAHTKWSGWNGLNVSKVASAHYDGEWTLVMTSDGRVFSFGDCATGNLGTGLAACSVGDCHSGSSSVTCQAKPSQVSFPTGAGAIVDISAGDDFALALDADGNVFGWGNGAAGLVGNGCCAGCAKPCTGGVSRNGDTEYHYHGPQVSSEINATALRSKVKKVVAGSNFAMVMVENGGVYAIGKNMNGQLGLGFTNLSSSPVVVAQEVKGLRDAADIKLGSTHGLALMKDGSVRVWGNGRYGQTGQGLDGSQRYKGDLLSPKELVPAGRASLIGVGQLTSFYKRTDTSKIWAFGKNTNGDLGQPASLRDCPCSEGAACTTGQNKCEFLPKEVPALPADTVQIAGGEGHTLALAADGNVWATGSNQFKQLGVESCGSGTGACMGFVVVGSLMLQDIVGVEVGAQWSMAWRRVLAPPTFNPPPGEYGPGEVQILAADVAGLTGAGQAKIFRTSAHVARGGDEVWPPYPQYTSAASFVGMEQPADAAKITLDQVSLASRPLFPSAPRALSSPRTRTEPVPYTLNPTPHPNPP